MIDANKHNGSKSMAVTYTATASMNGKTILAACDRSRARFAGFNPLRKAVQRRNHRILFLSRFGVSATLKVTIENMATDNAGYF